MNEKSALICGISGQDGTLLAKLLLSKGYQVYGTSRDAEVCSARNLERLEIRDKVKIVSMAPTDFRSVLQVIQATAPDEIYNLSGQSSVALSFLQPVETLDSIAKGTLNLLEAIRFLDRPIRFYNAGSSEVFGDTQGTPANEMTPFRPRSPYGVAKASAIWEVINYRESYGLFACSGILFNHESELRPNRFIIKKIVNAACRIKLGEAFRLDIGNVDIARDWGWAEEYVYAMHKMLQVDTPDDFVIATGETNSLRTVLDLVAEKLQIEWDKSLSVNDTLFRPSDIPTSNADPVKAKRYLGWSSEVKIDDLLDKLISAELKELTTACNILDKNKNISRARR